MAKRILRYAVYVAAGLWMFVLGVLVGRGTVPISFDTRQFQARLHAIALEYGKREQAEKTVDLRFYDVLNLPVVQDAGGKGGKEGEIVPAREPLPVKSVNDTKPGDDVPVKFGKKMTTLDAVLLAEYQSQAVSVKSTQPKPASKPKAQAPRIKKKTVSLQPDAGKIDNKSSNYTIQLAAFQSYNDAASHIAALGKKGVTAYQVKGRKSGTSWYRVRTGAFVDHNAALSRLEKLKAAKINGMIIKKEE